MSKDIEFVPGKDYSRRELLILAVRLGWSVESKGKTGHVVCIKEGNKPFDVPTNPAKKTKQRILKQMGLKQ